MPTADLSAPCAPSTIQVTNVQSMIGPCRMFRYPDYKVKKHNMYQKPIQQASKKIRRKCATVAPYLLCARLGSHPQPGEQGKTQKIRRKCATVAPYLLCARLGSHPRPASAGKPKKIRRKRATVAPYSIMYQKINSGDAKNTAQTRHICTISFRWQTNQAIARSWHCQEHSAILLYTAESTCSFCLKHFP